MFDCGDGLTMQYIWLLASLYACVVANVQAQCSKPTLGPNMVFSDADLGKDEFPEGSEAKFKCDFGHVRQRGSTAVTCNNQNWTKVTLICERKNCGSPGDILNGDFTLPQDGTFHTDRAIFHCNKGYNLVGSHAERICNDGGWTGRNPVCEVVTCGEPPRIENGDLTAPGEDYYNYNSVVQYSCKGKHILVGAPSIVCEEDGTWKPDPPQCKIVECDSPNIENAKRIEGRPPYGYRSFVTFECNQGFTMRGERSLKCEIHGNWSHSFPTCEAIPTTTTTTTKATTFTPSTPKKPTVQVRITPADPTTGPDPRPRPTNDPPVPPRPIVWIVVGVIIGVLIICCGVFVCYKKKHKSSRGGYSGNVATTNDDPPQPCGKSDPHPL